MAGSLGLQAEELVEPSDGLFDILAAVALCTLPVHEGVAKLVKALWQIPSSVLTISEQVERKYYALVMGSEYLYTHPAPNSLVACAVNKRDRGNLTLLPRTKTARGLTCLEGRFIHLPVSSSVAKH